MLAEALVVVTALLVVASVCIDQSLGAIAAVDRLTYRVEIDGGKGPLFDVLAATIVYRIHVRVDRAVGWIVTVGPLLVEAESFERAAASLPGDLALDFKDIGSCSSTRVR